MNFLILAMIIAAFLLCAWQGSGKSDGNHESPRPHAGATFGSE